MLERKVKDGQSLGGRSISHGTSTKLVNDSTPLFDSNPWLHKRKGEWTLFFDKKFFLQILCYCPRSSTCCRVIGFLSAESLPSLLPPRLGWVGEIINSFTERTTPDSRAQEPFPKQALLSQEVTAPRLLPPLKTFQRDKTCSG